MYQDIPILKNSDLWNRLKIKKKSSDPNNFINIDLNKDTARINFSRLE